MSVYNKIKWGLSILMIFVIVITTNLIDKNNFTRVKNTVTNIYNDRLIAKDLIFKISNRIHKKQVAIILNDIDFFENKNINLNKSIDSLLLRFEQTNLTKEESLVFNKLKNQIHFLKKNENENFVNLTDTKKKNLVNNIEIVKKSLNELSDIQVFEGGVQFSISKKALSTIELFTQIEIYFLIALVMIIQVIILYNPKKRNKVKSK